MKYCPFCGFRLDSGFAYCPRCGKKLPDERSAPSRENLRDTGHRYSDVSEESRRAERIRTAEPARTAQSRHDVYVPAWKDAPESEYPDVCVHPEKQSYTKTDSEEKSFGHWILGFLLPVVGLILYLTMQDSRPAAAKSSGNGALVKLIVDAVLAALFMVAVTQGYIVLT